VGVASSKAASAGALVALRAWGRAAAETRVRARPRAVVRCKKQRMVLGWKWVVLGVVWTSGLCVEGWVGGL